MSLSDGQITCSGGQIGGRTAAQRVYVMWGPKRLMFLGEPHEYYINISVKYAVRSSINVFEYPIRYSIP